MKATTIFAALLAATSATASVNWYDPDRDVTCTGANGRIQCQVGKVGDVPDFNRTVLNEHLEARGVTPHPPGRRSAHMEELAKRVTCNIPGPEDIYCFGHCFAIGYCNAHCDDANICHCSCLDESQLCTDTTCG